MPPSDPFRDPLEPGVANYWVREVTGDELDRHLRLMTELQRLEGAWVDPYFKASGEVKPHA
jgi:hypothetical protein